MSTDIEFDEFCDANNPRKIRYDDILAATKKIVGAVVRTPCTKANMSEKLGLELYLKQEFRQFTGSFKERGIRNTLMNLSDEQRRFGVITASTGNHAMALIYHSKSIGVPCLVVMSGNTSPFKLQKCQQLGGNIIMHGSNIIEAKRHAMTIRKEKNMFYINGYDHPHVIEGQGTIGIEILDELPTTDAIVIPVGGGSLICGIAVACKHLKPDIEIFGVETEKTYSMTESFRKNERIYLKMDSTLADGLTVNMVGVNTFYTLKGIVDKMVVVKEDWVARAMLRLVEDEKFVVEGAGATALAAIMAGLLPNLKGKKVVCILSGGNITPYILARAIERGMALEGRLFNFKVTIPDRPGSMAELCSVLAGIGVSLRDSVPEKAWVKGEVFSVELTVTAETTGWDNIKQLIEQIKKNYKDYYFHETGDPNDTKSTTRRGPCLAPNPICMQK